MKIHGSTPAPGVLFFHPDPSKSMYFHRVLAKIDYLWESISPQPLLGSFSNFKLKVIAYRILTKKISGQSVRARVGAINVHVSFHNIDAMLVDEFQ